MNSIWPYAAALLPSIGVGYIFYLIIKNILEGDRNERLAQARWEKEQERAVAGQSPDPRTQP
ncbi:MAG: lysyl-tRNA synthetase [Tetrasphaera sp.]